VYQLHHRPHASGDKAAWPSNHAAQQDGSPDSLCTLTWLSPHFRIHAVRQTPRVLCKGTQTPE